MNATQNILQMVLQAGLNAGAMPQVGQSGRQDAGSSFQALLEDKRAQSGGAQSRPAKDEGSAQTQDKAPAEDARPVQDQTDLQDQPAAAEAAAALISAPCTLAQLTLLQAEAADGTAEIPVQAVQDVPVQPQAQAAVQEKVSAAAEQPVQPRQFAQEGQPQQAPQTGQAQPQTVQTEQQASQPVVRPQAEQAPAEVQPQPQHTLAGGEQKPQAGQTSSGRQTDETATVRDSAQPAQPLFRQVEQVPVKVGETPVLETQSDDFQARLSGVIRTADSQGLQRVELQLSPASLDNVVVELTRSGDGALHVALRAESEHALRLLTDHASGLSQMLQAGGAGEVRVEVQRPDQSQQPWQHPDQGGGQQGRDGTGQEDRQRQNRQRQSGEDFLQRLRIGLLDAQ